MLSYLDFKLNHMFCVFQDLPPLVAKVIREMNQEMNVSHMSLKITSH